MPKIMISGTVTTPVRRPRPLTRAQAIQRRHAAAAAHHATEAVRLADRARQLLAAGGRRSAVLDFDIQRTIEQARAASDRYHVAARSCRHAGEAARHG